MKIHVNTAGGSKKTKRHFTVDAQIHGRHEEGHSVRLLRENEAWSAQLFVNENFCYAWIQGYPTPRKAFKALAKRLKSDFDLMPYAKMSNIITHHDRLPEDPKGLVIHVGPGKTKQSFAVFTPSPNYFDIYLSWNLECWDAEILDGTSGILCGETKDHPTPGKGLKKLLRRHDDILDLAGTFDIVTYRETPKNVWREKG